MDRRILVSACLLGCPCRYDGGHSKVQELVDLNKFHHIIPICPEELGRLPTPRPACEIIHWNGKEHVITKDGQDVTERFKEGAQQTLEIAKDNECLIAILKGKSPSCGFGEIYDGSFNKKLIQGNGITAQLLHNNGFKICNELNYHQEIKELLT